MPEIPDFRFRGLGYWTHRGMGSNEVRDVYLSLLTIARDIRVFFLSTLLGDILLLLNTSNVGTIWSRTCVLGVISISWWTSR